MGMPAEKEPLHPAAEWVLETEFGAVEVDCTTTVALKILDGKCKMLPGEKAAVMVIYDILKGRPGDVFGPEVHAAIARARVAQPDPEVMAAIHAMRVEAEARIPKPVMKAYKAVLRKGLFG